MSTPHCSPSHLEILERRTLFAIDLSVSDIDNVSPHVGTLDAEVRAFRADVTLFNSGTTASFGTAPVTVSLRANDNGSPGAIVKTFDAGAQPAAVSSGATRVVELSASIPADMPVGAYFLEVTYSKAGDVVSGNNTLLSDEPVITVIAEQWPGDSLAGTLGDDRIFITGGGRFLTFNGVTKIIPDVPQPFFIDANSGADKVICDADSGGHAFRITGSGGNDTIQGGGGADELSGANGKDKVFGGAGNDYLLGGAQNDYLTGEAGNDTMSGAGGNDRLPDGLGKDHFLGGAGNDVFISRDVINNATHGPDTVSGGAGTDSAQIDESGFPDGTASIEVLIP